MGGSSGATQTVVNSKDLPDWLQEPLKTSLSGGREAFKADVPGYFSTVPDTSANTLMAREASRAEAMRGNPMVGTAMGRFTGMLAGETTPEQRAASQQLQRTAGGEYLEGNPYFKELLNQEMGRQSAQLKGAFSGAGRYGSESMVQSMGDALSRLQLQGFAQNYGAERQLQEQAAGQLGTLGGQISGQQLQAGALLPTIDQARFTDMGILSNVGAQQEAEQQRRLEDTRGQRAYEYDARWLPSERLAQLATGVPAPMGMTQTTYGPQQSTLSNILGAGIGAAGLFGGLF